MSLFGRVAAGCGSLVLSAVLSACSGGGAPGGEPGGTKPSAPPNAGVVINDQKDAAAGDLCSLLPPNVASSMGLDPGGKLEDDPVSGGKSCAWRNSDGRAISFAVMPVGIDDFYAKSGAYKDFQKLTIAGHPGVRANEVDPKSVVSCYVYVGTKQKQMLSAAGWINSRDMGKVDQCQLAQQALEAAVPALPSAK